MRHLLSITALSLLFTGCQVASKTAMGGGGGRTAYNQTIQNTTNEQMLLNVVRLRYFDNPLFLDVSTVTSQYTYRTSVSPSFKIPGFDQSHPLNVGSSLSWQNQPTIQYSPLSGSAFANQLMQPISLKTLQQLIYTGWDVDRLFRLVVQSLNDIPNAPLAAAPANQQLVEYERFYEITSLFRQFQLEMQLHIGLVKVPSKENGSHDAMQISFPKDGERGERLAKLLGSEVREVEGRYVAYFELGFNKRGQIGILPRSLLGCMYYASLGVHVPEYEIKQGRVHFPYVPEDEHYEWEKDLGSLLKIYFSFYEPANAYIKVRYRNKWYYIDDSDIHSKKTFVLLQQLYNLQSISLPQPPPILTIPVG